MMGTDPSEEGKSDEKPRTEVQIEDFWMGKYEITWDQFELFIFRDMESLVAQEILDSLAIDAISSATSPYGDMTFGMGKEGYPAVSMTQYGAISFCKWLSAKTGDFYRLPTEAEWEYACLAGSSGPWTFGDDQGELEEHGWYKSNSEWKYQMVGQKKANAWGLHDMHGNVAEWTMDQYSEDYSEHSSGYTWKVPETLYPRVVRGGSWRDGPGKLRCAARKKSSPLWKARDPQFPKSEWWHTNASFVGFRVVRPRVQPSAEEIARYWLEAIDDY